MRVHPSTASSKKPTTASVCTRRWTIVPRSSLNARCRSLPLPLVNDGWLYEKRGRPQNAFSQAGRNLSVRCVVPSCKPGPACRLPVGSGPGCRTRRKKHALPIVRDEFRPVIPRRVARQHGPFPLHRHPQHKTIAASNEIIYHRTVTSLLTVCLSSGDKARGFDIRDTRTAPLVAIINQTLAHRFFPGLNPVGKTFRIEGVSGQPGPPVEVVGVMRDGKYESVREDTLPTALFPAAQAREG